VRGDVEIHRRARDWVAHRHAYDPEYAQVVLHVVEVLDVPTLDADERPIATVALRPERGPPRPPRAPCVRDEAALLDIVEAAGRERFRARAARFEGDLAVAAADQVLWRGVAEALGYVRNTAAFGRLAEAVAWPEAARVVLERGPVGLAGLLLGTAGLLGQASLPEAHAWRSLQRRFGLRVALGGGSWDQRELRAGNAPARRCRGLAELAARWPACTPEAHGPAEHILDAVRLATGVRRPALWRLVWASPWIGRGRAQVIVTNVVLPFAYAAGMSEALELFVRTPGEPSNRIVRYMARLLDGSGAERTRFRGACRQQGLVQLFKHSCAARLCELCPARGAPLATFDD
jgi:hypothetical protein